MSINCPHQNSFQTVIQTEFELRIRPSWGRDRQSISLLRNAVQSQIIATVDDLKSPKILLNRPSLNSSTRRKELHASVSVTPFSHFPSCPLSLSSLSTTPLIFQKISSMMTMERMMLQVLLPCSTDSAPTNITLRDQLAMPDSTKFQNHLRSSPCSISFSLPFKYRNTYCLKGSPRFTQPFNPTQKLKALTNCYTTTRPRQQYIAK